MALAGVMLAGSLGCYGSFAAVRKVHEFNGNVTDVKFVHTLVMYAFVMVPVYSIATSVDVLILNPIEFWTDHNPLAAAPAPSTDTRVALVEANGGGVTLDHGAHRYVLKPVDETHVALWMDGTLVGITTLNADGSLDMADAQGTLLRHVPAQQADTLRAAAETRVPQL
jgi:hypothetical protein